MIEHIRGLYFSSHHLTRDLLANVAPFTAFAAIATIFFPSVQVVVADVFRNYLLAATVWTFILALIVYLAGRLVYRNDCCVRCELLLQRIWSHVPWLGRKCSYTYWYDQNVGRYSCAVPNNYFQIDQYLSSGAGCCADRQNKRIERISPQV